MNDDSKKLIGELVKSVQGISDFEAQSYLRIVCESGKKFEIAASIKDVEPKLELFEVRVKLIDRFEDIEKWPNGSLYKWSELADISKLLNRSPIESVSMRYTDQGFLESASQPGRSELSISLETGEQLTIEHESTPGLLKTEIHV